jgi:hypothetical protein
MAGSIVSGLRPSSAARTAARAIGRAHERFVSGDMFAQEQVRALVLESWRRSAAHGVDPASPQSPVVLTADSLSSARADSPLAQVMPLVRSLLTDPSSEVGHVVAVGDDEGRLLWVEGDSGLRTRAADIGFREGALWSEKVAGTNAPGTALATDAPVQLFSAEHFVGAVQPWSCAAVPVHDPDSGAVIGVIDVTGGDLVARPETLALVRATVAAAERELQLQLRMQPRAEPDISDQDGWHLQVLGRDRAVLHRGGVSTTLSARHSELLLLLAMNPQGLTADRLAVLLHESDIPAVTIRAELVRLRRILGPGSLLSRPYRLGARIRTDADDVADSLDRGAVRAALKIYGGALLPRSDAPAVAELRSEFRARLRRAAIATQDPDTILEFVSTPDGRDDVELLRAALLVLPARSPRRLAVAARLEVLDRSLRR